jgi:hypothetical protein
MEKVDHEGAETSSLSPPSVPPVSSQFPPISTISSSPIEALIPGPSAPTQGGSTLEGTEGQDVDRLHPFPEAAGTQGMEGEDKVSPQSILMLHILSS